MSRTINIIQGDSAAGCFSQAMDPNPGELLVNLDVLSCGPLPPLRSIEEWAQLRQAYWDSIASRDEPRRFNADLLDNTQALREADSIVLWLGTGAAEQLLFAWMVQYLQLIGSSAKLHLVQFTLDPTYNTEVWAMGLLHPDKIKLHPPVQPVAAETIAELERLWERVTSPDPAGLLAVIAEKSAHLPYSRSGLKQHYLRYPDFQTGLGRWEYELLLRTKEKGPRAARVVGEVMGVNFDADLVGDVVLFSRLHDLASPDLPHPLVTLSGETYNIQKCQVALTDAGESVLAGRANAVELNGIDDWVLGVHLDSKTGSVWYRKDGTLVPR